MIEFRIDPRSGVATYQQLVNQTRHALRLGLLRPGDQLPTAKEVVAATAINPNTVLKAYRELEREGLVEARRGVGTFVSSAPPQPDAAEIGAELADWVRRAKAQGLDREYVEALVKARLDEHYGGK
ncbi:GntR family transcriptional regulator [Saccharothrix sp. BKS2]|uniref:GntR family transcriptional regulator n=1 Tax=Saccharothrix sp. BKS2 TaxID=3064400 RepID=UPI0039EA75F4